MPELVLNIDETGYLGGKKFRLLRILLPGQRALLKMDDVYLWNAHLGEQMEMVKVTFIDHDQISLFTDDRFC
ncbi:MAG: hypothetical protein JXA42_02945 [Anaerolineales bacterium]|nr:hypothetical protein [Anaerolineales bacterium]